MIFDGDFYTVESVLKGHPDKVCDQVADAILDELLIADDSAKAAIECIGCGTNVVLAGEVHSRATIDAEGLAREVIRGIGYDDPLVITNLIQSQSPQLRLAIDSGAAGDQGVLYGFACDSQYNYLPYGVYIVNAIAKAIDSLRQSTKLYLPDGKLQLTIRDGAIETLIISVQHTSDADIGVLRDEVLGKAVSPLAPTDNIPTVLFNHRSWFIAGGFSNDTGLSGRKQAVDTYCGLVPHGGGSFSGKDPSKLDRTGAYMARHVAKSLVANGLTQFCTVALAYAFGEAEPLMVDVQAADPESNRELLTLITDHFDFRLPAITERLNLRHVRYQPTAVYGHFSDATYPWERVVSL